MAQDRSKPRIRWHGEELETLSDEMVRLTDKMGKNTSLMRLANEAQKKLPTERRRRIVGQNGIPPHLATMFKFKMEAIKPVVESSDDGPGESYINPDVDLPPPPQISQPESPTRAQFLHDSMIVQAFESIVTRAIKAAILDPEVIAAYSGKEQETQIPIVEALRKKHNPEPLPEGARRRPVLLVIGKIPAEQTPVQNFWGNKIKFRWWGDRKDNQSYKTLRAMSEGADRILVNVQHCSHEAVNTLRTAKVDYKMLPQSGADCFQQAIADFWKEYEAAHPLHKMAS